LQERLNCPNITHQSSILAYDAIIFADINRLFYLIFVNEKIGITLKFYEIEGKPVLFLVTEYPISLVGDTPHHRYHACLASVFVVFEIISNW
jgi:hypothetical protein